MDIVDDDEDFYAPEEPTTPPTTAASQAQPAAAQPSAEQNEDGDLEEGEEEDEGAAMDEDDSDIDIITEREDGTKAPPPAQSRYSDIRNIPQRTASSDGAARPPVKKEESTQRQLPSSGAELPAVATSKVDVNAIPIHMGTGKPITQVNIDEGELHHLSNIPLISLVLTKVTTRPA
jgi:pre-mRNA 3'-end-processing factor FIP1